MRLLLFLVSAFGLHSVCCQNSSNLSKVNGKIEIGYLNVVKSEFEFPDQNSYGVRLRASIQRNINNWSVGLGFGLDGYHNPPFNTAPVYIEASKESGLLRPFLQLGNSLKLASNMDNGLYYSLGASCQISKQSRNLLRLGYVHQDINKYNSNLGSLSFSILFVI